MRQILAIAFISVLIAAMPVGGISGASASETAGSEIATPALPAYSPRFDRAQPVIAVVGENTFTELTDYVVPFGILSEANVADVYALATQGGALQMFPALRLQPQATTSDFDVKFPEGADYVIVPAVHHADDPDLIKWIVEQSGKGSTIIGVCDGVRVLANAGLLSGHKAVGHWYSFDGLADKFPETDWLKNTRYVADKKIVTTTGVTASIPVSIALIEAIAGTGKADAVAHSLGIDNWGIEHQSDKFKLNARHIWVAAANWLAFWSKEKIGIPIEQGVDEVTLALTADAYSRTYRSKAFSLSNAEAGVKTKHGLRILPDKSFEPGSLSRVIELEDDAEAGSVLDTVLGDIKLLYGMGTAKWVALQLEYAAEL